MRGAVETKRVLAKRKLAEVGSILSGWRCFGDAGGPSYRSYQLDAVEGLPCLSKIVTARCRVVEAKKMCAHTLGPVSHGQFQ